MRSLYVLALLRLAQERALAVSTAYQQRRPRPVRVDLDPLPRTAHRACVVLEPRARLKARVAPRTQKPHGSPN